MNKTTDDEHTLSLSGADYATAYRRGFESTRRFLLSRGIEPLRAEEIAQAAWTRGWERRDALRDPDRVVQWVNTIALNVFRNRLRRTRETAELPLDLVSKSRVNAASVEASKALKACNRTERALLVDRYVKGYSSKEVAEKYHLSPVAVRVRTMRARRKAAAALAPAA